MLVDVRVVKSDPLLVGKNENRVLDMRVYEKGVVYTCWNTLKKSIVAFEEIGQCEEKMYVQWL
jgi:hypothetical protein